MVPWNIDICRKGGIIGLTRKFDIRLTGTEAVMSRVQLALNVDNLDEAVAFYSKLFNTQPAKLKEGYANFAIAEPPLKLVLIENPGNGGSINHLGVEVESSDRVHEEIARLLSEGMFTEEQLGTTCCFATQDKVWVSGPAGERWEVYTVLADSETFGTSPELLAIDPSGGCSCDACDNADEVTGNPVVTTTSSCC
jgi:catechol 2,3-dioxygenase-like lactoylglutathione lyase family enzyme